MATFTLNDLPSVTIAVHRIASPTASTATLSVLTQCAPPNIVHPASSPSDLPTLVDAKITTHRISIDPRSCTLPLPRFVHVTATTVTSDAIHAQYSTAYSMAMLILTSVESPVNALCSTRPSCKLYAILSLKVPGTVTSSPVNMDSMPPLTLPFDPLPFDPLPFDRTNIKPGDRICVAISG